MAIVKNNFRVSRLKGEISPPRSKESMSTDEDELQKHSSASDYDEEEAGEDDNEEEDEEEDVDSGMDSDDVDLSELGEVKEELCQVGNQICSVPFELYDLKGLSDILSVDVWNECLTEEERFGLAKYLPDMDQESFLRTMKELFSGGNFHFGSPLVKLFDMLKGGSCEPRVMLYQHGWNFFQKFRHYHNLRKYQNSMVGKFVQINNTWLSCKGYSIEERLRVLNVTRSQRNLLGDKREDMGLESDSSGREELGDGSYTRKLKETHGSKMGYVGSPTVDTMVRYGKPNPKGILKLPGSKGSAVEGLTGSYPPRSYNSQSAFPRKELIPGYHSGTARQSKSITKVALPRNREVFANEPLIGVPLSVHAQRKNWNADQITEMTTRLDRGSPDFSLRDAGKKSKFDRSPHTSVEDRTYNGNGRPQPPMSKFIPLDRSLGNQSYHPLAAKEEVFSEDWDIRGDKWKVRPEFQNNANRVGFDTKFRRYGSPQPHLNDRFSPSGQKAMKSQKKIKRESMQNGFDLEEFSQSDETESDSSEQLHEGNHSRSNLGYPSGSLEGHGKNNKLAKKEKLYDNNERLHLQDVEMYTPKGKQKGKVQDPRYLHGYATGISEESGFPMSGNDGRRGYKSLKADHMQSEQYQPYSSGKKKKGQVENEYHGYSRDYIEEDSSPVYLDDPGRVNRVVKKGQPLDAHATGRHERANMPILECSTSSKKRKGKSDMPYMSGLGESDVYYSPQQQVEDSPSLKKRGKREPEMDSDSLAMVNVEQVVVDVEPETKPGKKPFILITPSIHTGFSFSIIHLLSAVRIALVTPLTEDALAITNYNGNAEQNGKHDTLNGGTSISDQTRGTNLPALTVHEIVNRVKSNPGDPAILETQEPLQDLVRGVLKIFSSKTAPLGAKGWKALVSYEKPIKSWSWIGPVSSSAPDPDMVEEVTSCESWNLPHKMLVKLVDSFANWLKNGQETLQQIGSLPAPPLILMQPNLDEKERFRDLRAQKSLTTISPSTEEVRAYFRREEILRYSVPDRAFSYTAADGRKSIVAPLRRGGGKPTSKARDHPILKPDRPPHVTILCLVRDAAARLPGSIGTRADVCMLIRDSQYIVEDVTDAQVNQVVSGALDRLHYERDPCVQFDSERKLWVYLHRDREEEDFEDDGTSSTKKWKRPRKDPSEQSDNATPNVAYQEQTTSGFGGGTVTTTYEIIDPLSMQPGERMDLIYQGNTGSYMASEQGRLHQGGRPVDWSLNSLPENNMLCLENSTNEDYDEPFRRDRRFSASINNGVT